MVPLGLVFHPNATKAYVTNYDDNTVSIVDTATSTVVNTITVGRGPNGVSVTSDGTKAYVPNSLDNTVSVITTANDRVATTIPGFNRPGAPLIGRAAHGQAPVAVNETKTTPINAPVLIDLGVGATGNPISAAILNGPAHGTLGPISGTQVTYTPNHCYAGTDSFTFRLSNAFGTSNMATATITISGAPTAANVTATTVQNVPVSINLAAGACGSPIAAAPVGPQVGGAVSGYPSTTVTFTPATGFSGTAHFQFELANAFGASIGTATITVSRPPVLSVTPTYRPVGAGAGSVSFAVSNTGGSTMTYTASVTSGQSWLHFSAGQTGGSGGTITVHYDANTGALRSGTIRVTATGASGSPVTGSPAVVTVTQSALRPTLSVHLIDPFIFGADLSSIDLKSTFLWFSQYWAAVEAKGLVADGVPAAIAVVQTDDCANSVVLTSYNGTTLLPWNLAFLTTAPVPGQQPLSITAAGLELHGGFCFGAA
jgi:YVTN family beta-propeller protein